MCRYTISIPKYTEMYKCFIWKECEQHLSILYKKNCDNQLIPLQIDLGILFDEKLTFKEHIQEKVSTAYMMLGIIKRNFKYLTTDSLVLLYKSMVRLL